MSDSTSTRAREASALLDTAANSLDPEHARTNSAEAEAILVQLGIKDALAEAKRRTQKKGADKMVEKTIKIQNSFVRAEVVVAICAAKALGFVEAFASSGESTMTQYVHFVGPEADVDRAIMLAQSWIAQAAASRRSFWAGKEDKGAMARKEQRLAKRAHVAGWGKLALDRLDAERFDAEQEAGADARDVLQARRERISAYVTENYTVRDGRLIKPRASRATESAEAESEPAAEIVDDSDAIEATETSEPEPVDMAEPEPEPVA